jgi:MSHA pilin protein MshC
VKLCYGFTLTELIIVVILLGILSVTALPRMFGKGGEETIVAQDQMLSVLRLLQIQAMQNTGRPQPVTITLAQLRSDVLPTGSTIQISLFDRTGSGGNPVSDFTFSSLGQPKTTSNPAMLYSQGLRFEIQGESSLQLCIESEGYIHPC